MDIQHHLWRELHPDLLDEIAKYVDSFSDYVRLRLVCKQWNLQLPRTSKYIKNLWLVLPFGNEKDTHRPFWSLEENRIYHLELTETQRTVFRGSYHGWLITVGIDGELQILDPFTRVHFNLPPLSTFPDVIDFDLEKYNEEYNLLFHRGTTNTVDKIEMQKTQIHKLIISSLPGDDQSFMALAIYGEFGGLCFCRHTDSSWTDLLEKQLYIEDATFHEGKLYAIDSETRLYEFDLKTGASPQGGITKVAAPPKIIRFSGDNKNYVVGTPFGLLLVMRSFHWYKKHTIHNGFERNISYRTKGFEIYKLSQNGELTAWSKVNSLRDYVLVIGYNVSLCLPSQRFPDSKRNRIYFTDNNKENQHEEVIGGHDIGVYNLEDGSINQLFPNSDYISPAPVWIVV